MLVTVAAFLDCRHPAFFERTVTMTTVRIAGPDLGVDHLVGTAINKACTFTAAVFDAETLAFRGSGAARDGARPPLASAMLFAT